MSTREVLLHLQKHLKNEVVSEQNRLKKLSNRYRKWLLYRARRASRKRKPIVSQSKRTKRTVVTAWFGDRIEKLVCTGLPTKPPAQICFENNPSETLEFFERWRERFAIRSGGPRPNSYNWTIPAKRQSQLARIRTYTDYSVIEDLSTAAALVMTAEYDRAASLIGSVPPTINLDDWGVGVFNRLYELGFFEVVGLSQDVGDRYRDIGNIRTMRIARGSNASILEKTSEKIIELSKFVDEYEAINHDVLVALNSALSEAMSNVSRHAYPTEFEFKFTHTSSWWITASADRINRKLTVVFYDQGASIPFTLPRKTMLKTLQDSLTRRLSVNKQFEYQDDATYIEFALQRGKTQTDEPGRGEGLPQMKDLVDVCGSGSLTIRSRGGVVRYEPGKPLRKESHRQSVGGTLIEWVMDLPRVS